MAMEREKRYRLIAGLAIMGVALLLLISVATYDPHDPPLRAADFPPNAVVSNLVGIVGAYVAYAGRMLIGAGCYLIVVLMFILAGFLIAGRRIEDVLLRAVGSVVLLLSWCAAADLIMKQGGRPAGYGGLLGKLLHEFILEPTGPTGSYLIVILGFIVGAMLAADVFVLWLGRKSVELLSLHGEAAGRPGAEPATANGDMKLAEQKELLRQRLEAEREAAKAARSAEAAKEKGILPPGDPETAQTQTPATGKTASRDADTVIVKSGKRDTSTKSRATRAEEPTSDYVLPDLSLLDPLAPEDPRKGDEHIESKREVLERTLEEFRIAAQVVEIDRGPVITQFELEIAPGIKITRIQGLSDDLARALKAPSVRIVAPIPGKSTVGVEVPNTNREIVRFRELIESGVLERKRMNVPLLLGKDASGDPLVADLSQMPHLLIAGATGSGKSVCINSVITSFLMTQYPDELKLILIDPKMVELSSFRDIPHLMTPVVTDMKKAAAVLEWAAKKMDERYSLLANVGARNITAYNALGEAGLRRRLDLSDDEELEDIPAHMPYIVIIIDELADLMMIAAKEVENTITRIAQKSRAVGIHLIVATQRPSVDVVTGLIKANLPSRLAFQTASKIDSRTILDRNGAEKLLGGGDMLFLPPASSKLIRAQGAYTSDEEIRRIVSYLKDRAKPRFEEELSRPVDADQAAPDEMDDLYEDAVRIILESQRGSVSLLQRKLGIGYSRAARLVDLMADAGIVGDYKGSQAREVMYTLEEWDAAHSGGQSG